eukprot:GSChrysophyteH1.ASY1.ANO1.551.1 assembled CDS
MRTSAFIVILCLHLLNVGTAFLSSLFGFPSVDKDARFVEWFKANGGEANKVGLEDFPGMGKGVSAIEDIQAEEEILNIPMHLILSKTSLMESEDPLHVTIAQTFQQDDHVIISVLLLEKQRGTGSRFYEYISVLPEMVPNLSFFSKSSLEHLQDSELISEVLYEQAETRGAYKAFASKAKKFWPGGRKALPTLAEWKWAAAVVDSRGLRFQGKIHLAPFADMFNYEPHVESRKADSGTYFLKHHHLSDTDGSLRISADRDAAKGMQLLEDYGDNRDKIYLQYHGFVVEHNPFRCIMLNLPPIDSEVFFDESKRALLKSLRFSSTPQDCVEEKGSIEMASMVYMIVMSMNSNETTKCYAVANAEPRPTWNDVGEGCRLDANDLYVRVIQTIREALQAKIASYPTSLEEDEDILLEWLSLHPDTTAAMDVPSERRLEEENNLAALRYRLYLKRHLASLSNLYQSQSDQDDVSAASENLADSSQPSEIAEDRHDDDDCELRVGEMAIDVTVTDADLSLEQQLERFNRWFNEQNPSVNHLEAAFIPGWRIGTIASRDIQDGETYLGVPTAAIMSSDKTYSHPVLSDLTNALQEEFGNRAHDDFHLLAFLLLFEYEIAGRDSFYWPYLSLLPTRLDQKIVPTQWTESTLYTRLGPSHVIPQIVAYQKKMERTFESVSKVKIIQDWFQKLDLKYSRTDAALRWENYRWAQAILDSRSIWWDGSRHLVPMLDFINCVEGPDASRIHSTNTDSSKTYAITNASWDFAKGDQLFENYGQANYIYFMYHGFALPVGENSNDCIYQNFELSEEERQKLPKTELIHSILSQVGFDYQKTVGFCLSVQGNVFENNKRTGLPVDVWLAMALKQNLVEKLRSQKILGKPNAPAIRGLLELLQKRVMDYKAHFDSNSSEHSTSLMFLETEFVQLQAVVTWLQKSLAEMEAKTKGGDEDHWEL